MASPVRKTVTVQNTQQDSTRASSSPLGSLTQRSGGQAACQNIRDFLDESRRTGTNTGPIFCNTLVRLTQQRLKVSHSKNN